MDLSISIVSWNTRDLLDACLKSVYETTRGIEFEVIVVDNASSDGSADMVARDYPEVKLLRNTENTGFARANNQALKQSSGRYFLLLNSDTIVHDGALAGMVRFMDARPDCGACGPMLLNSDGTLQPSWSKLPTVLSEAQGAQDRRVGESDPSLEPIERLVEMEPFDVGWVGGACLMARREAIDKVGPMDEGYFMYYEETDWCWRMHRAGYAISYLPSVSVTHIGGASSKLVPLRMALHAECSRLRLLWKTGLTNRLWCGPLLLLGVAKIAARSLIRRRARLGGC